MARQPIDIGTIANDGTGDKLRTAFNKVNQNFGEVYANGANTDTKLNSAYEVANAAFGVANTASIDVYGRTVANSAYDHANGVAISANNYAGQMANAANSLAIYSSPAFVVALLMKLLNIPLNEAIKKVLQKKPNVFFFGSDIHFMEALQKL